MCIAVDEITQPEDCDALIQAAGCGVSLLATAHASGLDDLKRRPVYKPLLESAIFEKALILRPNKSWRMERI
jgi:stage III sporulation protein AA